MSARLKLHQELEMGVNCLNFSTISDYATADKYSAVELHMELPVPYANLKKIQDFLDQGEWDTVGSYLIGKYPHTVRC
jgi:hypothetical protein